MSMSVCCVGKCFFRFLIKNFLAVLCCTATCRRKCGAQTRVKQDATGDKHIYG
jgi:hypothetical protein